MPQTSIFVQKLTFIIINTGSVIKWTFYHDHIQAVRPLSLLGLSRVIKPVYSKASEAREMLNAGFFKYLDRSIRADESTSQNISVPYQLDVLVLHYKLLNSQKLVSKLQTSLQLN